MNLEKIKYIDVTNMGDYAKDTEYKTYEDGYRKNYSIDDCYLVRTTDIFPTDKIIQTPRHANAYSFASSSIFGDYLSENLRKECQNSEEFIAKLKEFYVCFETLRSTIHFSINGLVGSHAYGDFSNRPFVIIEPLKYHLDNSLESLTASDTYYSDDMLLSSECILLIDEKFYNTYKDNQNFIEQISNFNIRIFKGDAAIATKNTLEELNKYYFSVNSHGYVNGLSDKKNASKMYKFIKDYAYKNNISENSHYYSEINKKDIEERNKKGEIIDKAHLQYILDKTNAKVLLRDKFTYALNCDNEYERRELLSIACDELISIIGLTKLKQLTIEFNEQYIKNLGTNTKFKERN